MFYLFPAFAQQASGPAASGGFDFRSLIPFALMAVVMYLLLIRPQQKKMKQHQELVSNVRRGDRVVTAGGLIGRIHKVGAEDEVVLELEDGVRARLLKSSISQVLAKTEPLIASEELEEGQEEGQENKGGKKPVRRKTVKK
jgi:preprotein translocase subunit YajC